MREAISIINQFKGLSFDQRASFHDEVVYAVQEGHESPTQIAGAIKNLQDILEAIQTDIKPFVIEEVDKSGGALSEYGVSFKKMEAGTKYDYSSTNDWVLQRLEAEAKAAKASVDERQKFLKTIPENGLDAVDEDTGDIIKLFRPIKSSTTTVAISLGKL